MANIVYFFHWYVCLLEGVSDYAPIIEWSLPTLWTHENQSREEAERRERLEERRSEKRKIQKKADADARKDRKVTKHCVFPLICGSGWSKSRLAKAAGAEPAGQMRDEKVHAVVARSTFRSQNAQNTPDHFWKSRCQKSAHRCGAKHISKWKCTKHTMLGPLLEVAMSKKCTPLWREAHVEVKMLKAPGVRTTFGGSDIASRGRRKGLCTLSKVSKTWGICNIFNYNHHYTTLHSNTLHCTTATTTTTPSLHSTTLHSTTLHCTQLHSITLHSATLHCNTLQYTTCHYTSLHFTTLHYTTLRNTTTTTTQLHSTPLHYTTWHYTPQHYNYNYNYTTTLHYTPLH